MGSNKIVISGNSGSNFSVNCNSSSDSCIDIIGNNFGNVSDITINGKTFSSNNVNHSPDIQNFKVNKEERIAVNGLTKFSIGSENVPIEVRVTDQPVAIFSLNGTVGGSKDMGLNIRRWSDELMVDVLSPSVCFNSNVKLTIELPKMKFERIELKNVSGDVHLDEGVSARGVEIKTKSGNVHLDEGVSVLDLVIKTTSGNVDTQATFERAQFSTKSGELNFTVNAMKDIFVEASSVSGNVLGKLNNIRHANVRQDTVSGFCRNCHDENEGHIANIWISTVSGNSFVY